LDRKVDPALTLQIAVRADVGMTVLPVVVVRHQKMKDALGSVKIRCICPSSVFSYNIHSTRPWYGGGRINHYKPAPSLLCVVCSTTMNLQEATENFTSSLTTAAVNLGSAVNKLQSDWQEVAASTPENR
jgi:hypothetical protein